MQLDLVDLLRCPNDHADTPLVCVARELRDRELVTATLGCPICHAEFAVQGGVAWLGATPDRHAGGVATVEPVVPGDPAGLADVQRLAAMLDLATPGGTVALSGGWAVLGLALAESTSCAVVVLGDDPRWLAPGHVSVLAGALGVPLARRSLRGIALGTEPAAVLASRLAAAGAALTHHGRLVAPASCVAPPACHELARDARWWVAERREAAVSLRRAPGRTPNR